MTEQINVQLPSGTIQFQWTPSSTEPLPSVEGGQQFAVYVEQFISDSDTEADRTSVFNSAMAIMSAAGGGILHFINNHRILGDIVIPENVALVGPKKSAGQIVHLGSTGGDYERKLGVLRLASTATIRVSASAFFGGAYVIRDGLNLPFANLAEAQAGLAAFAGTAITMAGSDASVANVLILGFNLACNSNGHSRLRYTDVQGDCINGIRIAGCLDIPYLTRCHFWPFTTANYLWTASDATQRILTRPGIGFELKDTVDWAKVTNCFTYGYFRGFRLANVNATTLTACASDSPVLNGAPAYPGAVGVLVEGSSLDTKITDFTAAGKSQGLFLGTLSGCFTEAIGCNNIACDIGINVRDGDVQIIGGLDRVVKYGLQVQSATSKVTLMRKMRQVTIANVNAATPANVQIIGTLN